MHDSTTINPYLEKTMKKHHHLAACLPLLVMLLSWRGIAMDAYGQQQAEETMPDEFSEREALQTIARLQSKLYTPAKIIPVLRLQLDMLKSEVAFHSRMKEELERNQSILEARSTEVNEKVRDLIASAERKTGMAIVDRETTAQQMRNCVIELQRTEWELATEKGLLESKSSNVRNGATHSNREALRAELEAIKSERQILEKKKSNPSENQTRLGQVEAELDVRIKALTDALSSDSTELNSRLTEWKKAVAERKKMLEAQREVWQSIEKAARDENQKAAMQEHAIKLSQAEADLAEAMKRLEALAGSTFSESAVRVFQSTERKKAIAEQLEMLKEQREVWMSIESKQAESGNLRKRSEAIAELISQSDLRQLSRKTTIRAIEDAFKNIGVDDSELPKHENDKRN
jgi:hypothetical protein